MAGGRFFVIVASLLVISRILYEVVPRLALWPTTNGGTRMTGPQQITDNSLIIMYLIYLTEFNWIATPSPNYVPMLSAA